MPRVCVVGGTGVQSPREAAHQDLTCSGLSAGSKRAIEICLHVYLESCFILERMSGGCDAWFKS